MTKVFFVKDIENGQINAIFPELYWTASKSKYAITCYAHVGQHSACSMDWVNEQPTAKPAEYQPLLEELKGQGYDDLKIVRRPNRT